MNRKNRRDEKIMVPQEYHKLLPRKSIAAVINNASLDEAVCLVAPYGCGKTLAVVSWLRESGHDAAWLTLDENDNTEANLMAGLSAAIKRLSGWQGLTDDVLADAAFMNDPMDYFWQAVSDAEKQTVDKILVIDRFRFIKNPELQCIFKDILSALLGSWRVVIISRAELPSAFNDMLLKRHICPIFLKELGFSKEETAEFFSLNSYSVSKREIARIIDETEGWPAALSVILILSRGGTVKYSEAAREYLMDFFETEIWSDLNNDTRDFLVKTSVLDKLTPASCNAVTDVGVTRPVLRWLYVNGVFLFRLEEPDSFRYHKVFRQFLLHKLELQGIDKRTLYKKYAWWLFEKERYEQAFTFFAKAEDMYGISRVFRLINSADMGIEKYMDLVSNITALNIEELRAYPLVVAKIALVHYALGNLSEMQRMYTLFIEMLKPSTLSLSPEEYAECMWEAGWLSYLNPQESVLDMKKHEEWLRYTEYYDELKGLHQVRAAAYRFPSMLRGIRDYCPMLKNLDEYLRDFPVNDKISLWRLDIVKAEYAYELENFALAEQIINSITPEIEKRQLTDLYFVCIALLVKVVRAKHNPKEIGVLSARVEMMIQKNDHTFLLPRFHAFELRNRLADGIAGQTEVFEKENIGHAEKPYFYLLYRHITLVRALISTKNYSEPVMILGNMERICRLYNRTMDLIEVFILRSVAEYGLGNEDAACRYMTDAINNAREYGFIRIFSDEARDVWSILEIVARQNSDAYIKSIIISCKKMLARAGIRLYRKTGAQSELTKTEVKILKTLHTDMSYEEIAHDNNIKLSTVKSHLHSIYSKLGVDSRSSAVMAAVNMGLTKNV